MLYAHIVYEDREMLLVKKGFDLEENGTLAVLAPLEQKFYVD